MISSFLCPHCALSVEAGPELFGAEVACPGCAEAFVVPHPSAVSVSSEALEQALAQKEALEKALEETKQARVLAESEVKRLAAEVQDGKGKGEAERVAVQRRMDALEVELAQLRKTYQETGALREEYAALEKTLEEVTQARVAAAAEVEGLLGAVARAEENGELALAVAQKRRNELELELEGVRGELTQAGELAQRYAALEKRLEEATQVRVLAETEMKRRVGEEAKGEGERVESQKRLEELETELAQLRKASQEVAVLGEKYEAIQKTLEEAMQARVSAELEVKRLGELTDAKAKGELALTVAQKQVAELESTVRKGAKEVEFLSGQNQELEQERARLQGQIRELSTAPNGGAPTAGVSVKNNELEQALLAKESLELAVAQAHKGRQAAEADVKRLVFEAQGAVGKRDAERATDHKHLAELESEMAGLRRELKQVEGFSQQNQALVQERNRLQDRIQEMNVQQKAQQLVPESWGYAGGGIQSEKLRTGSPLALAGVVLLTGVLSGVVGAPFVFQKYPKLNLLSRAEVKAPESISLPESGEVKSPVLPGEPVVSGSATVTANTPPAPVSVPVVLPDSFQGITLGAVLADLALSQEKVPWKELNGRLHRKVELGGQGVEAVLVPDQKGRLVMGAYVRICSKQIPDLTPFLEWAVSVQDSFSAQWGPPSDIHQISGVEDTKEVVEKISAGGDFYQAVWDRQGQDTHVILSIRSLNERSVVFRLEYKSLKLTQEYIEKAPVVEAGK